MFARVDSFSFNLARTGWFDQDVLWLAPDAADQFTALTDAVCAAFPQYPP
jgi:hypothetical protein